jgi:hypothetical protein
MRVSNDLGMVLLSLWLILTGILGLLSGVSGLASILPLLALATGAVLLLGSSSVRTKNRNPGFLLLSIWLIGTGVLALLPINTRGIGQILALVAIGAGVMLLVAARGPTLSRFPGMLLFCVWLILTGLLSLGTFAIPGIGTILALLALVSGILILLGR